MPTILWVGKGMKWVSGASSGSLMQVAGTQVFECSPAASREHTNRNMESEVDAPGTLMWDTGTPNGSTAVSSTLHYYPFFGGTYYKSGVITCNRKFKLN